MHTVCVIFYCTYISNAHTVFLLCTTLHAHVAYIQAVVLSGAHMHLAVPAVVKS